MMRISDLQMKKIINISSGKSIGNIVDVNVLEDGRIESFVIDSSKAFFSFNKDSENIVLWNDIDKIGEDVILVRKG
ncbi:MAG: YlmC/YmxH family sporulation protein [Bacilli bacterium]|nr:YlmC/YmxH family sporulation protein [Bacilli bacterium]